MRAIRKFLIKRLLFIPPGIAAIIATFWAQQNPEWTERVYSRSIYPVLSTAVGYLPSLIGFSLAEWLVVLFPLFCVGYVVYYIYMTVFYTSEEYQSTDIATFGIANKATDGLSKENDDFITANTAGATPPEAHRGVQEEPAGDAGNSAAKGKGKGGIIKRRTLIIYRGVVGAIAIGSMVYFIFAVLCGLNYHRQPFTTYTGYSVEQSSVGELEQLCASLAEDVGQLREQLEEEAYQYYGFDYYADHSIKAIQQLAEQYPALQRKLYTTPKPVLMSNAMSIAGIRGIYFPFTAEPSINTNASVFSLPTTMTHELAHQCGFMREDEAGFIAYLACTQYDEPLVRYSGLLLAFTYSIAALETIDSERASSIISRLPESVQSDMKQREQYWSQHSTVLSDISDEINDLYLKANNQEDGVRSYGRMVDLLLAEQRTSLQK